MCQSIRLSLASQPVGRNAVLKRVKARCTQEENSLLARRRAKLSVRGVRFINQELVGFLPDRTLESVKGLRKRADYRTLVQEHIARINREAERRDVTCRSGRGL